MKKVLFSIVAVVASCTFFACSNGDYLANPTTAANNSVNPLNVLDSAGFNWSGTDAVSCNIDGNYFNVDSTKVTFTLTSSGTNVITAFVGPSHGFTFNFNDVYAGNIYPISLTSTGGIDLTRYISYTDSPSTGPRTFYSYLGNVGQVQILRNDPQRIIGKFHFQGLDHKNGTLINVSNGWFNIGK